jgi:geranylgeranyl pyrophosphate synthase
MKAATLITDDFLDKSPMRNGVPSLYSKIGGEEAVLTAEILKSSATITLIEALAEIRSLSEDDRQRCILLFEDTYRTVCLGQLEEIRIAKEYLKSWCTIKESDYWKIIEKTTAVFIQLPLLLGSVVSHFNTTTENALRNYGLKIGLAYQLKDDVVDLVAKKEISGKPVGGDIREKKFRLPLLYCLRHGSQNTIQTIKKIFMKKQVTHQDIKTIIGIIKSEGGIEYCIKKISVLCMESLEYLSQIKEEDIRRPLEDITTLLLPEL